MSHDFVHTELLRRPAYEVEGAFEANELAPKSGDVDLRMMPKLCESASEYASGSRSAARQD